MGLILFKKDLLYFFVSKVFHIGFGLFILRTLSNNLSPASFGLYETAFVTIQLLSLIIGLGLGSGLTREVAVGSRDVKTLFSFALILVLLMGCGAIFLGWGLSPWLTTYLSKEVLVFVFVSAGFFALNELGFGLVRGYSYSKYYLLIICAQNAVFLGTLYFFFTAYNVSLFYALLGFFLGQVTAFLLYGIRFFPSLCRPASWGSFSGIFFFSFPLMLSNLLAFVYHSSDRYMLALMQSLEEVAFYSIAYRVFGLLMVVIGVVQMAFPGYIFRVYANNPKYSQALSSTVQIVFFLYSVCSVGLSIGAAFLVRFLSSSVYLPAVPIIFVLMMAGLFQGLSSLLVSGISFEGRTSRFLVVTFVCALVNFSLNFIWIPPYGMMGAAVSTSISMALMCLLSAIVSFYTHPISYKWVRISLDLILLFSFLMWQLFFPMALGFRLLVGGAVILFAAVILISRDEILLIKEELEKYDVFAKILR